MSPELARGSRPTPGSIPIPPQTAANRSTQWSAVDPQLSATWLSTDSTKAKQPCFSYCSPDHLAPHSSFKSSVAAHAAPYATSQPHFPWLSPTLLPHLPQPNPLSLHPPMTTTISVVYATRELYVFGVQSVHTCTYAQPVREAIQIVFDRNWHLN